MLTTVGGFHKSLIGNQREGVRDFSNGPRAGSPRRNGIANRRIVLSMDSWMDCIIRRPPFNRKHEQRDSIAYVPSRDV